MNDYTYEISHLLDAKYRLRQAKSQIKADEERAALVAVAARIQEKQHEADLAFAKDLALAHAKGVPQTVLRKQVLKTNDWGTWVYWRDLAEIEPDRVQIAKAKEATAKANAHFRWEENPAAENGYDFVLLKGPKGEDYPMRTGEVFFKEDRVWVVAPENDPERTEYLTALNNYPGGKDTLQRHMNNLAHAHRGEIGK